MANIAEKIAFIARLLAALPTEQPGYDKARLILWLQSQGDPVSYRQLQRDLDDLEGVGWVMREQNPAGRKGDYWICIHQGTRILGNRDMPRERAFALQLIQHKLQHLMPEQILRVLQEEFRLSAEKLALVGQSERRWLDKIGEVPNLLLMPGFRQGVFTEITKALLEDKWLKVVYCNKSRVKSERRLMPLGLASQDDIYYLIARNSDSVENRQFRVDRIETALALDDPFVYPDDFRLVDYMDEGFFNYPCGEEFRLVARIQTLSARHLQDTKLSDDQTLDVIDQDWIRLTATVKDSQRLHWWILGFGSEIVVEEPAGLREMMVAHIREQISNYAVDPK